jgi:hypothetical protein
VTRKKATVPMNSGAVITSSSGHGWTPQGSSETVRGQPGN